MRDITQRSPTGAIACSHQPDAPQGRRDKMDQQKMFKQMMEFQKATFDNSFNAMAKLQEQGESMLETMLGQAPWLPEEGRKAVKEWVKAYQKGRNDFKKAVDAGYEKVEEYFTAFDAKKGK
jgi:hypothetical protein